MATAAGVPVSIVHGWNDELIDAGEVAAWARTRGARLLLVDDGHRLSANVGESADAFAALLASLRCWIDAAGFIRQLRQRPGIPSGRRTAGPVFQPRHPHRRPRP